MIGGSIVIGMILELSTLADSSSTGMSFDASMGMTFGFSILSGSISIGMTSAGSTLGGYRNELSSSTDHQCNSPLVEMYPLLRPFLSMTKKS
jgi:hypothetical protein